MPNSKAKPRTKPKLESSEPKSGSRSLQDKVDATETIKYPNTSDPNPKAPKPSIVKEAVQVQDRKRPMKVKPEMSPPNRTEYVDYALDMLAHNLIGSGQLDPSKAHLVKTPEMRAHVNDLTDRVEQAQRAGISSQISSKNTTHARKLALQPNSLPITIITDKDPTSKKSKFRSNGQKKTNILAVPLNTSGGSNGPQKPEGLDKVKQSNKIANVGAKMRNPSSEPKPTPKTRDLKKAPPKAEAPLGNSSRREEKKTEQSGTKGCSSKTETEGVSSIGMDTNEFDKPFEMGVNGFKVKLDMRGYKNDEISLDLKEQQLTVTGVRPRRDRLNARKTTETIDIPQGINPDNLKIARRVDGMLVIQESSVDNDRIV